MRPWAIFQGLIRWSISEHWKMIKSHYALINSILNIWIVSNLFPPTILIKSPIQFGSWILFYKMQVLHCSDLMYNSKSICKNHLYILYIYLAAPDFVRSIADGDYVYFFFREQAVEYINCGKVSQQVYFYLIFLNNLWIMFCLYDENGHEWTLKIHKAVKINLTSKICVLNLEIYRFYFQ